MNADNADTTLRTAVQDLLRQVAGHPRLTAVLFGAWPTLPPFSGSRDPSNRQDRPSVRS